MYGCRCKERLKGKSEGSERLGYTTLSGTGTPKNRGEVERREVCERFETISFFIRFIFSSNF